MGIVLAGRRLGKARIYMKWRIEMETTDDLQQLSPSLPSSLVP